MRKYVRLNVDRPQPETVSGLKVHSVSTVYEAQGRSGLLDPALKPISQGQSVVGPVVTAICHAGDNLMVHAAIEAVKPGDVLVVATIGAYNAGMVGELIVTALMKKGVKGLIIDSGIRDAKEIRQLGFPVWSREITSRGSTKARGGWVNSPCVCGGVSIDPGDIIMADDDGIVVVEKDHAEATLLAADIRAQREVEIKKIIEEGQLSVDFYNLRQVLKSEGVQYMDEEKE